MGVGAATSGAGSARCAGGRRGAPGHGPGVSPPTTATPPGAHRAKQTHGEKCTAHRSTPLRRR
eukprot:11944672-Alexandrium_andersonii.AAC.1